MRVLLSRVGSAVLRGAGVVAALVILAGCVRPPAATTEAMATVPATPSPTAFPPSPVAIASPIPTCREAGRWMDFTYDGVAVTGVVPALVYLPPCYETPGESYPTAYFLHGKPYTEEQWIDLGLPGQVEAGLADGTLPRMILVLARQPEPLFSSSDGGQGSYETEFIEGLLSAIDGAFRTRANPQGRAVVGLSRGGVWALEIGLRNPDLIGAVAALSPALAVNYAREPYDPLRLVAIADPLPERFLLAAGDNDWARAKTEALAAGLLARGLDPELIIVPGNHSDPTWEAILPSLMGFLAGALGTP